MKLDAKTQPAEPLSPLEDITEAQAPSGGAEVPDVVVVFEMDRSQYASARSHFDHLIDKHGAAASVHFEDQI